MLQEYWLLLPQRLELVQYLSPAEHGVCNRQSADYGFYARVISSSSTEIRLSWATPCRSFTSPKESTSTSCFSTCRAVCILESNGWLVWDCCWIWVSTRPAHIPYLKPNFFHLVHPNSSPGCFQAGRSEDWRGHFTSASPPLLTCYHADCFP